MPTEPPPHTSLEARLNELISDARTTQLIYVAATLGLADQLASGPKNSTELALAVSAHPQSLSRLLRALASLGVFAQDAAGRFELTPLSELLQANSPGSLRTLALSYGPWWWTPMGHLLHSVRTGETAFNHVYGIDIFEYLSQNPAEAAVFDARMTAMTAPLTAAIVAAYDFSQTRVLIEVAGGQGALAAAILKAQPEARAILFDLPSVTAGARGRIETLGIADRCEIVAGDFFASIPGQGDTYILKEIIHDWDDARALAILRNCHRAMAPTAKLLIIEHVVASGPDPVTPAMLDISMLVMTGGLERTEAEYEALLTASGFSLSRVVATTAGLSVMEALPA